LNFTSKVTKKLSGFSTTGKGGRISLILLHRDPVDSCVPLLIGTVPFLEFSIEFQSNNLTFQQIYTNKQEAVYHLIKLLYYGGLGYRKISQKLNSWGIKTQRGKFWFNTSVFSVLKRKRERDLLTQSGKQKSYPVTVSEFKIKYQTLE